MNENKNVDFMNVVRDIARATKELCTAVEGGDSGSYVPSENTHEHVCKPLACMHLAYQIWRDTANLPGQKPSHMLSLGENAAASAEDIIMQIGMQSTREERAGMIADLIAMDDDEEIEDDEDD